MRYTHLGVGHPVTLHEIARDCFVSAEEAPANAMDVVDEEVDDGEDREVCDGEVEECDEIDDEELDDEDDVDLESDDEADQDVLDDILSF